MTRQEQARVFEDHKPMVKAIARRLSDSPDTFDELVCIGEGELALAICGFYGAERLTTGCSLRSGLYRAIRWGMLDYLRKRQLTVDVAEVDRQGHKSRISWLTRLLADLTEEAKIVVHLILNAPAEIAEEVSVMTRARGRDAVRQYLCQEMGWPTDKVDIVWAEIRACL